MGSVHSGDPRRISFDNNFAITPVITVKKSIEDDNIVVLKSLAHGAGDDLLLNENNSSNELLEPNNDYWSRRMEQLKKEHQSINKIIESEYQKTIEANSTEYELHEVTQERLHKIKPCLNWRAKIVQCYEENPGQPLMCSGVVKAFNQCVNSCRMKE